MYYESIKDLYDEVEAVFNSENYITAVESDLFMVTVSNGDTYLCKKFIDDDTEGIIFFFELDSVSSIYLIEKAVSENETETILFRNSFYTFVRQAAKKVPEKFVKFNFAAEIPERDDGKVIYGYNHVQYSGVEYLEPMQVPVLKGILRLIRTSMGQEDTRLTEENYDVDSYIGGISFKYTEGAWRKMLDDDFDDSGNLVYTLRPSLLKELKKMQPEKRIENLVFEIDYNVIDIINEEDGEVYKEIVDSVVAAPNRKCLYLNCGQHKTNIAAVLINAMLHSVSKDYYPEKIICRKMSVYLWFKNICNAMDIKLELVEELPSTFEMFKRLRGEDVGFPRTSCKLNI